MTLVVAAAGAALYVLAQRWFESTVEKRLGLLEEKIKKDLEDHVEDYLKTYSFTITAGSTIDLPYKASINNEKPSVFSRADDSNHNYIIKLLVKDKKIRIENKDEKDLTIDLLLLKARLSL